MAKKEKIEINRIKTVMVDKKVSQDQLAEYLGKHKQTISSYCTNANQPSLETLRQIALCLKVDIRELLIPTME